MFDAQHYRDKAEVEAWKARDPIGRLRRWLEENAMVHPEEIARIQTEVAAEVEAAVAFAEAGTLEPLEDLERFVTMDEVPV
jgi:TPP-dependent pyruvate/acetoin dehydrogenase alpha subunit